MLMCRSESIFLPRNVSSLVLLVATLQLNCGGAIKPDTLDYYKVAVESVDAAVREGLRSEIDNLSRECLQSDKCVEEATRKWFRAGYAVKGAYKYLQVAYALNQEPEAIKALACSVVRLREVNAIVLGQSLPLPPKYVEFFRFVDAQARGVLCAPEDYSQQGDQ